MPLKKGIGNRAALLLAVNAILGTEIFFIPAITAGYAGPAAIVGWVLMAALAVLISAYFAELISMFPKAGGVYEYTKRSFGGFASFLVGWISWIVANVTIAISAVGAFTILLPEASLLNIPLSVAVILAFNYICFRGIDVSAKMLALFGILTVALPLAIIAFGAPLVNIGNFSPLPVQLFPLLIVMFFVSDVFFGWEAVTFLAEEMKEPARLPKTLVKATAVIAAISIAFVFVVFGVAPALSGQAAPFAYLSQQVFGSAGNIFVLLAFIPMVGSAAAWIVSSPRLLYAMSRDRALLPRFGKVHKKYGTPHIAIVLQAVISSVIVAAASGNYTLLLLMLLPMTVVSYFIVMLSVTWLRIKKPDIHRGFKAPFGVIGPVLAAGFVAALLALWAIMVPEAISSFVLGISLVIIGIPMYVIIKLESDKRFMERFFDKLSPLWDLLFPVWYTGREVKQVLINLHLNNAKGAPCVLEFGCGSGHTTQALSEAVGSSGKVVAVDLSKGQLERTMKKLHGMHNVILMKHGELSQFHKNYFDAVTSVGVLEHFSMPEKMLREIMGVLKKGGRFSFLSFGKTFMFPARDFLKSEEAIKSLFRRAGCKANVRLEKKKLTEYWFIWGRK